MVEESADRLCLTNIHEPVSTCLLKTTLESLVCPMVVCSLVIRYNVHQGTKSQCKVRFII